MTNTWDGIIFDLDGTLWDAVKNITEIWNEGIKQHPEVKKHLTETDVRSIMGLNTKEIGAALFPELSEEEQWQVMLSCGKAERELLPRRGGILYPHLEEVLAALYKTVPLFIVSNCDEGYIEAFLSCHHLGAYFTDHLCYGDTLRDKPFNIGTVVKKYELKHPVYVGDTQKDYLSATAAGVEFIHAAYGYGNVPEAKYAVNDLRELVMLVKNRDK